MFFLWVSKSSSQIFSYKCFFHIIKAHISFFISSAEYCNPNTKLFNEWKNEFPSIWLGMIWNISVSETKFLRLSSGSFDSSDNISENSSINQLSYDHYSYFWFYRVDLQLILTIWSLSLGLVLSTHFSVSCSDILESLSFLILPFLLEVSIFSSPHRSLFVIFFYQKNSWRFLLWHFGVFNQYLIAVM